MKYEVIGWTHCGNSMYPQHKDITACVDAAVIRELQKHNYCFGGDKHENFCPVLNDGTYVSYSWRGWGRIMAMARGENNDDGYAYSLYYMDSLIDPAIRKTPKFCEVDDKLIVPKEALVETHVMHLSGEMFKAVKDGTKTVEIRLFDDKRKLVDIGDYIEFCNCENEDERVKKRVADLVIEPTFEELFSHDVYKGNKQWVEALRFTPKSLGAEENADLDLLVEGMYKLYSKEQEEKHGVMAFILEQPNHDCRTYLKVWTGTTGSYEIYLDRLSKTDIKSPEYRQMEDDRFDMDKIENALREIDGKLKIVRLAEYFTVEMNKEYDVDVNVMLRKTLEKLFGKEELLKEMQYKFCLDMTLEIVTTLSRDTEEPNQCLSIDRDIIEFLHKANLRLQISYSVV
ncbi:MAG: DUF4279 domain-containing protein [Clostridia bacterium]|nr:DUF4279 domain-containing protein [Clostridia bacterium]